MRIELAGRSTISDVGGARLVLIAENQAEETLLTLMASEKAHCGPTYRKTGSGLMRMDIVAEVR